MTKKLARISFGLSLLFVGIVHARGLSGFAAFVAQDLGPIAPVGTLWGYVVPFLMIVGGILFVIGMAGELAAWCAALALGSIPAGMLLKSAIDPVAVPLEQTMPLAINAFVWIIVLMMVSKGFWKCCSRECMAKCGGMCGSGSCGTGCGCGCGDKGGCSKGGCDCGPSHGHDHDKKPMMNVK